MGLCGCGESGEGWGCGVEGEGEEEVEGERGGGFGSELMWGWMKEVSKSCVGRKGRVLLAMHERRSVSGVVTVDSF